ncbi:uncharacterized protein LOC111007191 isoform X2 [Momordica charantia]|uniref:Uncharacterized protein LOC111007191 isoform X2 n=1 Tax=Momordica charantia TaxID=3673 RepID=A0A6J1C0D8_MOMCH|nr:uncharacterized protein LOC111007191 isoform X2 [Momordica charantia]
MVYSYTPTYYSTLHDSITSLCKSILPFSFKKRCLPAADQKLAKLQSDNLKWQQDSFHQMLKLMGLHKEGILAEHEVSDFRTHLLDSLIASPAEQEQQVILRDKLLFLQELLYAKCITADEYHSSKRPLLQRLAVQGAEIEARDVIVADPKENSKENSEEEWSVIDLRDEKTSLKSNSNSKNKSKHVLGMKQIRGAASVFSFGSSQKSERNRKEKSIFDPENQLFNSSETHSILMPESSNKERSEEKAKRRPFKTLFQGGNGNYGPDYEERMNKSGKKQWGFNGMKKWKRDETEDETAPLPLHERSDSEAYWGSSNSAQIAASPIGEGPNTKLIKRKLHSNGSPSDFFIDKVLGEKIKKELSRIQTELNTTNPNLKFSDDQIEAISTRLPVDKADLKNFFPKSWCDRYGDVVIDVVKKEFKEHVGEMENKRNAASEKRRNSSNSMRWTTFEDDENCQPNLFFNNHHKGFQNNPFFDVESKNSTHQIGSDSAYENPFWRPRPSTGLSMLK